MATGTSNTENLTENNEQGVQGIENPGFGKDCPPPYEEKPNESNQPYNTPAPPYPYPPSQPHPYNPYNQPQVVPYTQQPYYPANTTYVYVQGAGPLANPPEDYLCYSIFVTLFCCWIVGIFAIFKSYECRTASTVGNRVEAEAKSNEAKRLANIALGLGIGSLILTGIFIGVYVGISAGNTSSYRYNGY